ncbi:MAG TPA: AraC family transcriptional regulator [Verrucomicrobiae bacterium]|nr:AraC family transcriptional regulator [Verrucomicrobiae bacterium]
MNHKAQGFSGQRIVVFPRAVIAAALRQRLLSGLLPTDIGFYPKAQGHFMERAEGVDQAILIYCVKGEGWCEMAGNSHKIRSGDLLALPPGTPHKYGADERRPWTIYWVHIKGDNNSFLLSEMGITAARPVLSLGQEPELLALFEELLEVVEQGYASSRLLYASQILTHLIGLMIWASHHSMAGNPDAAQKVKQSIAFMKQHLDRAANVASFAAMANLSESHYRSLFKDQTGYAPMDYFIRLRIHKACQLLDTTNLTIKEIAQLTGYQDALYFSRAFKAVVELSPVQYRLQHKV